LGGCDPVHSFDLKSCVPGPVCKNETYALNTLDDIQDISEYLGDATKANWVSSGKPVVYNGDSILLTMAQGTVGTLLASTHYVWYGKVSATLTTSQGAGVVTAFILMSDAKDEIDFEFVGVDTQHVQSNYYFQGFPNYDHELNLTASNTESTAHTYTVDWSPDELNWLVDGKVLRTLKKSDTWNATANAWAYPQTPARIELSLWPAGLASNGDGTVDWAGGLVDWSSPYMQNGYYYAMFKDITVECYSPPSGANIKGSVSYEYTSTAVTNNTVEMIDDMVVLKSLLASGDNPDYNPSGSAVPSSTPESVPGVSGGGVRGEGSGTDSSSSASASAASSTGGFSQGTGSGSSSGSKLQPERVGGSVLAILVAVGAALCW
jgi:beta-glucanase (GH16 family)